MKLMTSTDDSPGSVRRRRPGLRPLLVLALTLLALTLVTPSAEAAPCRVRIVLKDGRRIEGQLSLSGFDRGMFVLEVRGQALSLSLDEILRIDVLDAEGKPRAGAGERPSGSGDKAGRPAGEGMAAKPGESSGAGANKSEDEAAGEPAPAALVHEAPRSLLAEARHGAIALAWRLPDCSPGVLRQELLIERQVGGKGSFRLAARLGPDARRWVDDEARAWNLYSYRVASVAVVDTAVATDPARKAAAKAVPVRAESRPSEVLRPAREFVIVPISVVEPTTRRLLTEPDSGLLTSVRVHRRLNGDEGPEWVAQGYYNLVAGEAIGSVVKRGGRELDFRSGSKLRAARIVHRPHPKLEGMKIQGFEIDLEHEDGVLETISTFSPPDELKQIKELKEAAEARERDRKAAKAGREAG